MARRFGFPALSLAATLALGGCAAMHELDPGYSTETMEDDSYFYDDFASYGAWVDVPGYGTVWCPDVATAWQPYTVGYWVYSDDGWFWVSEDPWGSVPYHYGRWAFADDYGWVWVPGDVWAPAWVAWRYGSGWVGWAPLPPDVVWNVHVGIDLDPYDIDRHVDHRFWSFTNSKDFGTHRERVRVEPFDKTGKLLKETRNVTNYAAGSHPVETGMKPALLQDHRGKVERYRVVDSSKPVPKSGARIRENQLEVYRPTVNVGGVRERVREAPRQKRVEPASSTPDVRERKEPEPRVAPPEEVARGNSRDAQIAARTKEVAPERREEVRKNDPESLRERRETVTVPPANVDPRVESEARQTVETAQREETARQREEAARQREEAVRQREEAARQREEAVRQREEAARQREEETPQAREKSADREKPEPNAREREVRERDSSERKSDSPGRERVSPKRVRGSTD
ncbi:MAG TPA: DUF6600 domain-containing protein [Candidatus Eisenbacteria bacterium]|nr:DUF6600 domain-containing protein [Candidatus Eisenbacteria bacterium]